MPKYSYKSDDSFLEKLAIGAAGTLRVLEDLRIQGHFPIELERGSSGYRIWKSIKIKRIRVPDILCVSSGIRIESRAKTRLAISMSHSHSNPQRGWDFGLKNDDYIALTVCTKNGNNPIDWKAQDLVQYIRVSDLRKAFNENRVIEEKRKGAGEGFEVRLTWPASIARSKGKLLRITEKGIQYKRESDNRTISLSLKKQGIQLRPLFSEGNKFEENTILASAVPISRTLPNTPVNSSDYGNLLSGTSIADRYAAAKAFSHLNATGFSELLIARMNDVDEHIYVRLECAATLTRIGNNLGFSFINEVLTSQYLENRLEAVIVLGEIHSHNSRERLEKILADSEQHIEIRSGAAWALGELPFSESINSLVQAFNGIDLDIRQEAARALRKLANEFADDLIDSLACSNEMEQQGIAWALAKSGKWSFERLNNILQETSSTHLKQWITYIFGISDNGPNVANEIEGYKASNPEIYFATTLLWKVVSSWVDSLKEY